MSIYILLDSGPLGLVTNPKVSVEAELCNIWMDEMLLKGNRIVIPEITDYEVRRELIRAGKINGLKRLDELKTPSVNSLVRYLPITTETMLRAADYWAQSRQQGKPTADNKALDSDVILAAQANLLAEQGNDVIVATTNVGHLSLFVNAKLWRDHPLKPPIAQNRCHQRRPAR